ncbi:MAG: aminotransferase class IV [Phycisphaerales bacterium]|jgi:branched-subunit amino acid aminotransferase/4-amino-4-deoxychorismate lyase|nr:aminotransferase class IV [Phycisphaerales bacterium]
MNVWVNGVFVEDQQAQMSVFDAGIQHGVGLFETMHARNGVVFRAKQHMERLAESAMLLRLTEKLQVDPLVEAVMSCVKKNGLEQARVRLTLTGGNLNMLNQEGGHADPTIIIQTQKPTPYPDVLFEKGVHVSLASGRINPYDLMAGHKTLNYWSRLLNLQLSASQKCGEALWLTPSAHLVGGCVSNVFIVKNGKILTPYARGEEKVDDEPSAVLPGVTRNIMFSLAQNLGVDIELTELSLDDLLGADEVFLTNSSWGVLPVVGVAATVQGENGATTTVQQVGEGCVGHRTPDLRRAYWDLVDVETTG